ncbi:unnamed protein product, partial [Mesorhabditis spiculigera]
MTAADVRRHVMACSLIGHPAAKDTADGALPSNVLLLDVVEPVDVEDALSHRKSSALYDTTSMASPRKLGEFPADDIEVRTVVREQQTVENPLNGVDLSGESVDPHVRDVTSSLADPFSLVQRRYQQFGSGDAYVRMLIERPIIARNAPMQTFENENLSSDRLTRSASLVETEESKRNSYGSAVSSCTMGS